jgi:hypothetical protein
MPRRLLRTLFVIATVTVVWLLVSPSSAWALPNRAPICDPRGAITFAPPPQIQDAEVSLDIPADCFEAVFDLRLVKNFDHGRSAPPELTSSQESMTSVNVPMLAFEFSERTKLSFDDDVAPPSGVRASLERPPQA